MSIGAFFSVLTLVSVQFVGASIEPDTVADAGLSQETAAAWLAQELDEGEALIWYLGHCGWAIKTQTKLLVLDYWEQYPTGGVQSLTTGRINPEEINELDVFVFVTHDHGDHYDPVILEWAEELSNVTYVFGWNANLDPGHVYMHDERETRVVDGLEINTINHRFDNIPEVAYLVTVDGLTIYHSGDHGSTTETPNQTFSGNIDYLAGKQDRVDIAFISTFGRRGGAIVNNGDLYTIERLEPRVVFPMHHGGGEDLNQRFATEVAPEFNSTSIVAASHLGDRYFFSDGNIQGSR